MIEFTPTELDDADFLLLAQRIANGAIVDLQVREVFLVHVDNWFDFKWLGWWSWGDDACKRLVVPPFNPNRVLTQEHYVREGNRERWKHIGSGNPLHVRQAGRQRSLAKPIDEVSGSAAFVWYSGNTARNMAGSLMVYRSGADGYAWYASFKKDIAWIVNNEAHVSRRELLSFEKRGREMEFA